MFTPYQYTSQGFAGRNLRVWVAVEQEENDTGETVVKFVEVPIFVPIMRDDKSPVLGEVARDVQVMRPGSQKEKNLKNARKAGFELDQKPTILMQCHNWVLVQCQNWFLLQACLVLLLAVSLCARHVLDSQFRRSVLFVSTTSIMIESSRAVVLFCKERSSRHADAGRPE